jgi:membrane fusion protein (multidrug efflux system)
MVRLTVPATSRFLSILLCLSTAAVVAGCQRGAPPEEAAADPQPENRPVPVAVAVLTSGPSRAAVRAWGTVRPLQEAVILAEVAGRVTNVEVGLGEEVRRGQLLLEIDPDLHMARTAEAEAAVQSAQAARDRAVRERERRETLFERGTVSDSELELARTQAAQAEATLSAARATVEQAKKNLSTARLMAPFEGYVASRPPDRGSTVNLGTPLITLVDIDLLRVDALVSEQDLPQVHVGSEVTVTAEAAPGRIFPGMVVAVGPQADRTTRQFPVEVEVENPPDLPLKGGVVARVEIIYESHENIPLLPVDAYLEDGEGAYFFAVRNGVATRRNFDAGPREGQWIGVLAGAAEGDTVVVVGQDRLVDGAPARVEEVR